MASTERQITCRRTINTLSAYCVTALFCCMTLRTSIAADTESITVNTPSSVSFYVDDVRSATIGVPAISTLEFQSAHLTAGHSFRLSAVAASSSFIGPGGTAIPVSLVSWTTSSAIGGSGVSGSLDYSIYHSVFESYANPSSGRCDISFRLGALPSHVRAGAHSASIVWKVESIGM